MDIVKFSRNTFLDSVVPMDDFKSLNFAKEAMELWDNFYSWEKYPPLGLKHDDETLCYLFYSTTRDNQYLIIHRILTPKEFRGKRYAYELLANLFLKYSTTEIERFRMSCVSSSINFYNKIGLNYWGVNTKGQYYCDFKMPKKDINEIPAIVKESNINELSDKKILNIYENLEANGKDFNAKDLNTHNKCLDLMGDKYRFNELKKEAILI
ncbi:MAG: hypothetical protein ACNI25_01280 [Halarcobacter sp.]